MSGAHRISFKKFFSPLLSRQGAIAVIIFSIFMVTCDRAYFWWVHPLFQFPDQSLYLDTAKWILEGKVPYRDFFDWNPPLIMFLSMIPLAVSKLTSLHPITALNMLVIWSTFASACLSLYIADRYLDKDEFFIFVPMLVGATYFSLEQMFDMAEREQIFMIVYLPFMLLRYVAWTHDKKISRALSIFVGLVAGLGLALKPQFVGAAAGFELVLLFRTRQWKVLFRPEVYAVAAIMLIYSFYLFVLLPKEAWDVLKNEILPLFMYGYEYSSKGLMFMLHGGVYFIHPITMLCFSIGIALLANRASRWAAPLATFTLISFANYLHGDQAWVYRMIPMVSGAYLLYGMALGLAGNYLYKHTRAPKAVATSLLLALLVSASCYTWHDVNFTIDDLKRCHHFHNLQDIGGYIGWTPTRPLPDLHSVFYSIMKHTDYGGKVCYIGTGINDGYPAIVQSERRCSTRYPFCVLVLIDHCILNRPETEKAGWQKLMVAQVENYRQDILKEQPELIMILDYAPFVEMLHQYGFFKNCLNGYRVMPKYDNCMIFVRHPKEPYEPEFID